jgi:hypothetical protein
MSQNCPTSLGDRTNGLAGCGQGTIERGQTQGQIVGLSIFGRRRSEADGAGTGDIETMTLSSGLNRAGATQRRGTETDAAVLGSTIVGNYTENCWLNTMTQ